MTLLARLTAAALLPVVLTCLYVVERWPWIGGWE